MCSYFHFLGLFLHHFIVLQYFSVIFGGFLTFWNNFEIQDGGCLDIMK